MLGKMFGFFDCNTFIMIINTNVTRIGPITHQNAILLNFVIDDKMILIICHTKIIYSPAKDKANIIKGIAKNTPTKYTIANLKKIFIFTR